MSSFRDILSQGQFVFFDGALGTQLQARGLQPGQSPESFGLARPDVLSGIHADYVAAGARVVTTNTFGGTRFKLEGVADVRDFNRTMARIARQAAGDAAFVAGSVGPTGHFVEPMGRLSMRDLVDAFHEQIEGLVQGGADLILAETHFDLAEAKAVVLAARQVTDLPVGVSMTFEASVSLTGTPPLVFLDTMRNMGVDLVGMNCGSGPEGFLDMVEAMLPRLDVPLLLLPNAGLPELEDGRTVFRLGPEEFAARMVQLAERGVKCLGGCCGTTPSHIRALAGALRGRNWSRPEPSAPAALVLTSRSVSVPVGPDWPVVLVGERINPTGKKMLTAELQAGDTTEAQRLAREQVERGARVLDVNVGAPMVREAELLPELVKTLVARTNAPLCIDSTDMDAVEAALWAYPASPLVNSISGEPGRMERLGPLCRDHGAPFIMLPLRGRKLPVTAAERIAVIEEMLGMAESMGIPRRLVMVDVLALAVSTKPEAAKHCLDTIRYCRDRLGLPTILGLSNISFGLPAREIVNSTFLAMCMSQGMAAAIANPESARLRETLAGGEVLLGRDPQAGSFIAGFANWTPGTPGESGPGQAGAGQRGEVVDMAEAVVAGAKDRILPLVEAGLAEGETPEGILDGKLIPAIMRVGEMYERREYFLPQLILSAETMQLAFDRLRPLLAKREGGDALPTIVMATVEGDIHDIGKNIVSLMLRNHGFEVVDLGKDVSARDIVDAARQADAELIGLSALMTTTMVRMRDTVELVRREGLRARVVIGGAVVSEAFARSIGADGYAADAVEAVRIAKQLLDAGRARQITEGAS